MCVCVCARTRARVRACVRANAQLNQGDVPLKNSMEEKFYVDPLFLVKILLLLYAHQCPFSLG